MLDCFVCCCQDHKRLLLTCYCRKYSSKKWELTDEPDVVKDLVLKTCFGELAQFGRCPIGIVLVSAFAERFYFGTTSFQLPVGEVTITLDDVHNILGLPIDGTMMKGDFKERLSKSEAAGLLQGGLGLSEADALDRVNKKQANELPLSWLVDNFKGQTAQRSPQVVARAFIMHLIGSLLLPNTSSGCVPMSYLQFLKDLNQVNTFSWGSAVLAYLYNSLHKATR